MKLRPYPEYKDSGVPWLGKIPAHWKSIKTKYVFRERVQKGYPNEPLLAATQTKGVVPKSIYENRTVEAQKDLHLLKLVEIGDFVISLRSFQGGIEYAYYRGIISPAYTVIVPNKRILQAYFRQLAKSKKFIALLQTCVTGIREGQNINYEILRKTPIPVPTDDEQTQIARFLDWKTSQINKFIRNKRRLIELLKEQKQNVINQAVTRGLNPKVRLKPSGVEWIGDIPEHWEVRRLKFLCHNLNEQTSEKQPGETYIALEHVESWTGRISLPDDEITFDSQVKRFQPGDVLFGKLRPYLAKVTRPQTVGVCVGEFLVLRATGNVSADFLEQKLRSKRVIDLINSSTFGAKMPRADWTFIGNLKFAYPPADEQQKILEHIQEKSAEIDQAIIRAEREIELMREYRTRLISDVVTGQVDVRGIEVPEVAEEELLTLDEDTAETDDVIDDEGDMDETD
jgi:type I restriction enzyme S subunit